MRRFLGDPDSDGIHVLTAAGPCVEAQDTLAVLTLSGTFCMQSRVFVDPGR
jgi:hypothetical protein